MEKTEFGEVTLWILHSSEIQSHKENRSLRMHLQMRDNSYLSIGHLFQNTEMVTTSHLETSPKKRLHVDLSQQ